MLSINELALSIQELEDSTNNNRSKNPSFNNQSINSSSITSTYTSSRQLFRKCKKIIQQQMAQIDSLSKENQTLNQQLANVKAQNINHKQTITTLESQGHEITSMNQSLHKEMNKLTQQIQQLNEHLRQKQNLIKLTHNKNQSLQLILKKLQHQNRTYKQKCQLMQGTIELMKKENWRLCQVVREKEEEMKQEVEKLKQFKQLLEKRNHVHEVDLQTVKRLPMTEHKINFQEKEQFYNFNPFKTIGFSQYPEIDQYQHKFKNDKTFSDCKTADRTLQKASINKSMHSISPYSIVEQKPILSRIRKNLTKPKPSPTTTSHPNHFSHITIQPQKNQHLNTSLSTSSQNPQLKSQLTHIKKEIMKQYNMIELKKEMMNQGMIGQTLKEIERKLEKMTKISRIEQSESEME